MPDGSEEALSHRDPAALSALATGPSPARRPARTGPPWAADAEHFQPLGRFRFVAVPEGLGT